MPEPFPAGQLRQVAGTHRSPREQIGHPQFRHDAHSLGFPTAHDAIEQRLRRHRAGRRHRPELVPRLIRSLHVPFTDPELGRAYRWQVIALTLRGQRDVVLSQDCPRRRLEGESGVKLSLLTL